MFTLNRIVFLITLSALVSCAHKEEEPGQHSFDDRSMAPRAWATQQRHERCDQSGNEKRQREIADQCGRHEDPNQVAH